MPQHDQQRWDGNGLFVFLHPAANPACFRVAAGYQQHPRATLVGSAHSGQR